MDGAGQNVDGPAGGPVRGSSPSGTGVRGTGVSGTPPVPPARPLNAWVLRGIVAAGLLLSADIHLFLYLDGYRDIDVVGPLFLLNAVAGLVLGLMVLVWRHWLPLLGAAGFGAATLVAFYTSTTVGLFGVNETIGGTQQVTAAVAEWVVLVGALVTLVVERRRSAARKAAV